LSHHRKSRAAALRARLAALCPEREIFLRSGGQVRFLRISRRLQLTTLSLLTMALVGWGGMTLAMIADSASVTQERAALAAKSKSIATAANKVEGYRQSVDELAQDLEARQDFMDTLYKTHFGGEGDKDADMVAPTAADTSGKAETLTAKISMAPEAAPLVRLEERQRRHRELMQGLLDYDIRRWSREFLSTLKEQGRHPGFVEHRVYPHCARQRAVTAEGPPAYTARLPPRPCDGSADAPFKVLAVYPLEYRGKVVMRAHGARPCLSRPARARCHEP